MVTKITQIFTKIYYLLSKFSIFHNLETHFCELLRPRAPPFQKIEWNPWNLVTTLQKSFFLGPTIFEIPQPNWYYGSHILTYLHTWSFKFEVFLIKDRFLLMHIFSEMQIGWQDFIWGYLVFFIIICKFRLPKCLIWLKFWLNKLFRF